MIGARRILTVRSKTVGPPLNAASSRIDLQSAEILLWRVRSTSVTPSGLSTEPVRTRPFLSRWTFASCFTSPAFEVATLDQGNTGRKDPAGCSPAGLRKVVRVSDGRVDGILLLFRVPVRQGRGVRRIQRVVLRLQQGERVEVGLARAALVDRLLEFVDLGLQSDEVRVDAGDRRVGRTVGSRDRVRDFAHVFFLLGLEAAQKGFDSVQPARDVEENLPRRQLAQLHGAESYFFFEWDRLAFFAGFAASSGRDCAAAGGWTVAGSTSPGRCVWWACASASPWGPTGLP